MSAIPSDTRLDLSALLDAVNANRLTVEKAEAEIANFQAVYAVPHSLSEDFDRWVDDQEDLGVQLQQASQRLDRDEFVVRVLDLGRVAVAAARLLGETNAGLFEAYVGRRLCQLKAFDVAVPHLESAAALLSKEEDAGPITQGALADTWFLLVFAYRATKRFAEVARLAPEAVAKARALGKWLDEARLLKYGAEAARALGDRTKALEFARGALAAADHIDWSTVDPSESGLSAYYQVLGLTARNAGQIEQAIQAYVRGREVAAGQEKNPLQAALLLSEVGMTWEMAGEVERGEEIREQAALEAEQLGVPELAARWRRVFDQPFSERDSPTRLAYVAAKLQEKDPDLPALERMAIELVAEFKKFDEPELEAMARNALGDIRVRQERWAIADATFRAAIDCAARGGARLLELQFRINYGNLLGLRSKLDKAEPVLREAIAVGERLRAEATTAEMRQAFGALLARAYEQLAFMAVVTFDPQNGEPTQPPRPEVLFEISQRSRATNLNSSLALANAIETDGSRELIEGLLAVRAAEVSIEAASERLPVLAPDLVRNLATRRAEFESALVRRGVKPPDTAMRTVADLQSSLSKGELFLDLMSLQDGVAVAAVSSSGVEVGLVPWKRESRFSLLRRWRYALGEAAHADVNRTVSAQRRDQLAVNLAACWSELDELLWHRLGELSGDFSGVDRIYVVPHRELFTIPFWQLERFAPRCRISVLPSSQGFELLRARVRRTRSPRIAVGDVTCTLRLSKREIGMIGKFEACAPITAELFRKLPIAGSIHFAGHGFFDRDNPYYAGLAVKSSPEGQANPLSRADPWGVGNCELMTVSQIVAGLVLPKCCLTVLSACETGLPRVHAASEFTSLPAAFLIAGSRNAIASLWRAHDGAATLMMGALYRALDGADPRHQAPSAAIAAARAELSTMSREAVIQALGDDRGVPERALPFDSAIYLDAFQHYGPD
jgi:tetratricopeptide (TPR) repeat protein